MLEASLLTKSNCMIKYYGKRKRNAIVVVITDMIILRNYLNGFKSQSVTYCEEGNENQMLELFNISC